MLQLSSIIDDLMKEMGRLQEDNERLKKSLADVSFPSVVKLTFDAHLAFLLLFPRR